MALSDIKRNVLTIYSADASGQRKAIAEIELAVDKLEKKEKEAAGEREKAAKSGIDVIGKLGLAYNAVTQVAKDGIELARASVERMRLESAAAGVSIDKLTQASGGLVDRMSLLKFAVDAQHGAFALSEKQMGSVQMAIRELVREGKTQEEATKKVTDAVFYLKDDGLKDLGIQIRETHSDSEKFAAIMDKLAGKAQEVGDGTRTASEELEAMGVTTNDAFDRVKDAIGRLVIAMTPLLNALAKAVEYVAKIAENAKSDVESSPGMFLGNIAGGATGIAGYVTDRMGKSGMLREDNLKHSVVAGVFGEDVAFDLYGAYTKPGEYADGYTGKTGGASANNIELPNQDMRRRPPDWSQRSGGGGSELGSNPIADQVNSIGSKLTELSFQVDQFFYDVRTEAENDAKALDEAIDTDQFQQGIKDYFGTFVDTAKDSFDAVSNLADLSVGGNGAHEDTVLERMFGKKEQFDEYHELWSALSQTVGAAYDAMVDGSMGAGEAAKKALGEFLKALGKKLMIRGLEEGAEFIATGDPQHLLAAAAFEAGAVAAGVAAHELGGGGSTGSGARSSGFNSGGSGGGSSSRGQNQVVIVAGDDLANMTPRMRQVRARRLVEMGLGQIGYGVSDQ